MADADKLKAEKLKDEGNKELKADNLAKAIELYTEAIILNPTNHVYYSNRSAAFAKDKKYEQALSDAKKCVELKPEWAKGYSRLGAALSFLGQYDEAEEAYNKGLNIDPNNAQLKQGLEKVMSSSNNSGSPVDNMFAVRDLMDKLDANPKTRAYLQQPDYLQMLDLLKKNPKELGTRLQDPRIMETIGVLLGIPMSAAREQEPHEPSPSTASKTSEAKKAPEPEPEPMEVEPEPLIKQSLEEKQLGNDAYKKKDFETALQHYGKAIELDPKNMSFYTNRAAVYFEQGKYDESIKECLEAVDIGRENLANYKLIAKALLRIGNAYMKQKNYDEAKRYYDKSLVENRSPEALKKCQEVDKLLQELKRKAYQNIEIAQQEKDKGNECFKSGDFPEAVKRYNEALKRTPDDDDLFKAKIYSNRAGCYHKLAAFNLALEDCEMCIKLDPSFVKGYTRKGGLQFAQKRYSEAIQTYQKALEVEPNNKEAMEGIGACQREYSKIPQDKEEIQRRAMADPEVRDILQDPGMKIILEQMQENPKAAMDHLKNPEIRGKVQKLVDIGILQIR